MNWTKTKRPKSIKEMYLTETNRIKLEAIEKGIKDTTCILLTGPSGMGKTTVARIFAKKLTGGSSDMIREINAADTNGVDDARKLAEWSQAPTIHGNKKVIILDEAQMLTKNAQNCLLKPSEDSDMSCMIFCTTNPEKILPAIKGRATKSTVRFTQYNYELHGENVIEYLKSLCKGKLGEEYLKLIVENHKNIRAFVQILEQLMSTELVDTNQAKEIVGSFQDDETEAQAIDIIRKIAGSIYKNNYTYQEKLNLWSTIGPEIRDLASDINSFRYAMASFLTKTLMNEDVYRKNGNFLFLVGLLYQITEGVEISKERLVAILLHALFGEEIVGTKEK